MPAITVDDLLTLPSIPTPDPAFAQPRPVRAVTAAYPTTEGAGFPVWKAFAQKTFAQLDPFLMLDQIGPVHYAPKEALGVPWHPHRGFETVSYQIDGETAHKDSNGGGGLIADGDTQWMTAGAGILHDELPSDRIFNLGGPTHAIQLWVNLPRTLKMTPPAYQPITSQRLTLATTPDGGGLIRLIAGELGEHSGPGTTHTPITLTHVTLETRAGVTLPWRRDYNALAYILTGDGTAGTQKHPVAAHQLVEYGTGNTVTLQAGETQPLDVLLLGGKPIREPVAQYGPFVMNTRAELAEAFADYQAGRLGIIPATELTATPTRVA